MKPVNSRDNAVIEAGRAMLARMAASGLGPAGETLRNERPKVKPNEPCPCGSGKKYKKCCGGVIPAPEVVLPNAPDSIPPNME